MTPAILEHVWGVSPFQDRVWAQVSGLAPDKAGKRFFMVLQAFMDESWNDAEGTFVIAGHIASAENWAKFSADWESILPFGVRDKDGSWHFKAKEMNSPAGLERTQAFWRVIEKHVLMSLSCRINRRELTRARDRIHVPNLEINWGYVLNPYLVAFRVLMDGFHGWRTKIEEFVPLSETVDFYFDERAEKKQIREAWDEYMSSRPEEIRAFYGNEPRFEDDKKFLPLQAADLWAWWVRRWHAEGHPEKMEIPDFGAWKGKRQKHLKMDIKIDEDGIVKVLREIISTQIEPGRPIYDIRYNIQI